MKRAMRVLSSSEATTRDVMEFYQVPKERIEVIFEGYQDWTRFAAEAPALSEDLKPFFMFTGKVKPRKNVHNIIAAFISLKERTHSNCKLLIAGSYGGEYHAEMLAKLREHHLEKDVHFLGYVSAPMMYSLYTNAVALVFPSYSEGFGMPLVEAMSLGLPVIASNVSSLVEVVGDAGLLIDPHDPETISKAMEQLLTTSALKEELIKKGRERAKLFSWEKVGEKYRDVLTSLPRA
jgi:glycosyltransferase involved in cell wall biosynthesis